MFLKCFGESSSSGRQHPTYPTVIEELCRRFSLADIRKSTNNFDRDREIRILKFSNIRSSRKLIEGGAGNVYKGCLQHNDGSDYAVAVKRFHWRGSEIFKREVELLCQLRHPNCVSIVGFCNEEKEKIIVYEYMSNGSLDRHLGSEVRKALPWKKRIEICVGAARGLHYLHAGLKRTIIHNEINANNILLDDNMHPKLSGFGDSIVGAHFKKKPKPIKRLPAGTMGYSPIDSFTFNTIEVKWDVYTFGMTLLEVVGVRRIFELPEKCVEENIDPKIKGKIAPECWQVFIDIALRCIKNEPDEQPAMGEVEVQLELALFLQEQADLTNTDRDYTLSSKTFINPKS